MGLPGFSGFVSELYVLLGAWATLPVWIVIAAGVAMCNGLSSAQLAAKYPVSGGTYEYGYRLLSPAAGFTAGWLFLCAKTATAATAAPMPIVWSERPTSQLNSSRICGIVSTLLFSGVAG